MAKFIKWDEIGERLYETGIDRGVLYIQDAYGDYPEGVAWNGLTAVDENPSGAEPNPLYADNIKYLELMSVEKFEATLKAFTYPEEFEICDGSIELIDGVTIGQQPRKAFGLSYRTIVGNDTEYNEYGYKLHLVYGAKASPSSKSYETVNETPDAIEFSWDITTTPVEVEDAKPTATLIIDSTKVSTAQLAAVEVILYGEAPATPARLPMPDEVLSILLNESTSVIPQAPTFASNTGVITIPTKIGVNYKIGTLVVAPGPRDPIPENTEVKVVAEPKTGYKFPAATTTEWTFTWSS